MSEPRLQIQNIDSGHLLIVESDSWKASTASDDYAKKQIALFKVQWCEKPGKYASAVMIRTDCHPQSLLDASDLAFQGSALDSTKCYDKYRWWKVHYLKLDQTKVTVLFESYERKGQYLAESRSERDVDGHVHRWDYGVELIELGTDPEDKDIPGRAKWGLSIAGRSLSIGETTAISVAAPFAALVGGLGAAGAAATLGMSLTGAGVIGGVSGASTVVVLNTLKKLSDDLFVDW